MVAPYTPPSRIYRHHFLGVNVVKVCLRSPDAGFGTISPRAPAGERWSGRGRKGTAGFPRGGRPRWPRAAPHLCPRGAPGASRERPGRRGGRRSHSPRASVAWWGAGWGRSSCCRGRRRCTSSGRYRPAATAASGWSRSSRTRGFQAGPPAGLRRERGQEPGWGRAAPSPPRGPRKTPGSPGPVLATRPPAPFPTDLSVRQPSREPAVVTTDLVQHLSNPSAALGVTSKTPGKEQETGLTAEPESSACVSKDLGIEMGCGEVSLGPLTPPFRLFPSVSKLKSIIITVCHLSNPSRLYSINTDHWAPHQPTNILGHSRAQVIFLFL